MVRAIKDIDMEDIAVCYNEEKKSAVSPFFLNRQNAWHNLEEIKEGHWFRYMLFDMIEETDNRAMLKELAKDLEEVEFYLQELWGFPRDAGFHRFWEVPKCQCPKLDNMDNYPYRRVINTECPLHGN